MLNSKWKIANKNHGLSVMRLSSTSVNSYKHHKKPMFTNSEKCYIALLIGPKIIT